MFQAVRDNLFSLLFPQACFSCRKALTAPSTGNACAACWNASEIFDGSETVCVRCGIPLLSANQVKCWKCDDHEYDSARALGVYSFALQAAVVGLKTQPAVSRKLHYALIDSFSRNDFGDTTLIVPVPLSRQRKIERGFNQADVIAQVLVKEAGIPVDSHSLVRSRHSPIHRAGMDERARELSVRDSFEVARPKLVKGHNVLLVDDVMTTGSTASYCAKALKRSGAVQVKVFTIARAV